MLKLHDDIKKLYIKDSESLEKRKFVFYECLEDKIKQYFLEEYSKEILSRADSMWKLAISYWVMPEEEDVMKIINEVYVIYHSDNAI
jgi:hypothetical protein